MLDEQSLWRLDEMGIDVYTRLPAQQAFNPSQQHSIDARPSGADQGAAITPGATLSAR